jgi:oligopeptide transport system substrate-binding protein
MKKTRIISAILSAALIAAIFTGCEKSASSGTSSAAAKAITADVCTSPETLDPQLNDVSDVFDITSTMLEGLMKYGKDTEKAEYGIAESYTVSSDKLTYTFKLRSTKWSDGKAVTADDFVYSLQRLFNPKTAAPYASNYTSFFKNADAILNGTASADSLGVKAVDDTTFQITTPSVVSEKSMLDVLCQQTFVPLRKDMVSTGTSWVNSGKTYISDGAYTLGTYTPDSKIVVKKNPNYWDAKDVATSSIEFMFFSDDNAAEAAYQSGELDIYKNASHNFKTQSASISREFTPVVERDTYFMVFNQNVAPFNNILVRKAFALAMDNNYMAKTVRQGDATAATGIIGPGYSDYTSGDFRENGGNLVGNYNSNLTEAKKALKQAGYSDGKGLPAITYICTGSGINQKNAEAMQSLLKENLGVNVQIKTDEAKVYISSLLSGNYQFVMIDESAPANDCLSMLKLFEPSGSYKLKISDFVSDLKQAETSSSSSTVSSLLHKAENILINENYAIHPIYHSNFSPLVRKEVSGVIATPSGQLVLTGTKKS